MPFKIKKTVSNITIIGNSVYFNGSNQYLSTPTNAAYVFGTGDFTVEAWIKLDSTSTNGKRIVGLGYGANGTGPVTCTWELRYLGTDGSGQITIYRYDGSSGEIVFSTTGATLTAGTWYHIAASRSSGTLKIFVNGVSYYSAANSTNFSLVNNDPLLVGLAYYGPASGMNGPRYFGGAITNLRIVNGTAVYTSNFTPSTSPLTAIANTSLLTCNAATIIDGSTNNFTITNNNAATVSSAVTPFSSTFLPFKIKKNNANPVAPYSVQFNGTNQCLSVANNAAFDLGAGNFTLEGWVYSTSSKEYGILVGRWGGYAVNGNWSYALRQGAAVSQKYEFAFATNSSTVIIINALNTFSLNTWYHLAAVRNGTTFTFYVNGVSQGTTTNANAVFAGTTNLTVGGANNNTDLMNGYASNVRIVKGTALYTASFTVPTTPLTAITNTSLLTCNAATIVDSSNNNFTITNNGSATVSSTITPFSASVSNSGFKLRHVSYVPPTYMIATGGDLVTTSGSYKIHTFTTVGTSSFSISSIGSTPSIEYLIVGGGGAGGSNNNCGGGGAGGLIYNTASLSVGAYAVTIGQSGSVASGVSNGNNGGNSTFNGLVAFGGGGGGGSTAGSNGGSGGGNGGGGFSGTGTVSAIGLQPTSSYGGFGNNGGASAGASSYPGGGGGGAGAAGNNGSGANGGNGGIGKAYAFAGAATYYAGGGGGSLNPGTPGTGGLGGGGNGVSSNPSAGANATGYGSGGGGGLSAGSGGVGGAGSPGIILIKYRYTD